MRESFLGLLFMGPFDGAIVEKLQHAGHLLSEVEVVAVVVLILFLRPWGDAYPLQFMHTVHRIMLLQQSNCNHSTLETSLYIAMSNDMLLVCS